MFHDGVEALKALTEKRYYAYRKKKLLEAEAKTLRGGEVIMGSDLEMPLEGETERGLEALMGSKGEKTPIKDK